MKKQSQYIFCIREVGNCVWEIFSKEIFAKNYKIHYLTEPVMALIKFNVEEIKAVVLFFDDICGMYNKIIYMEAAV
jgi:hypothetical protein